MFSFQQNWETFKPLCNVKKVAFYLSSLDCDQLLRPRMYVQCIIETMEQMLRGSMLAVYNSSSVITRICKDSVAKDLTHIVYSFNRKTSKPEQIKQFRKPM